MKTHTILTGAVLSILAHTSIAAENSVFNDLTAQGTPEITEDSKNRWGITFENDYFVPGGRDQDYTYGLSANYTNKKLKDHWTSTPIKTIDEMLGFDDAYWQSNSIEVGVYGFTPEETSEKAPQYDDRPYASLLYISTGTTHINANNKTVIRSQLTLGALGLDVVGDLQNGVHDVLGNDKAEGWDNQVSDGGELTARYSLSRQKLMSAPSSNFELKTSQSLSIGYITEATLGFNVRLGKIQSAWHSFNPELSSYAESATYRINSVESFFWAGMAVKARGYNAFLQGQFKDSEVTYDWDELNHFIVEAWAGYTHGFENGYYLSYGLRGHTSEVKEGTGDRNVLWGGFMVGHRF